MINSRKITDLRPKVATLCKQFLLNCNLLDIDLLVTSTYRDLESQASLYAIGRTAPGKIVTNAKPGESLHNWRVAFDVVPLRFGKPVWGTKGNGMDDDPSDDDKDDLELWQRIGEIGKNCGLEWAGDWKAFKEFPHFQFTGGLSLKDLQFGKFPK